MARNTDDIDSKGKPGRKPSLSAEHVLVLRAIVAERPQAALAEVTAELARRCGVKVNPVTVRKALRQAGIVRDKPVRRSSVQRAAQGQADPRTGYTAMHRRSSSAEGHHTDLTDAEWALVADLFERDGKQGAPPRYERRTMVNACCYVVRTGAPWRLVPKSYAPWEAVYMCFKRWAAAGTFEAMHDRLRQQWRQRAGKSPEPTAAIIDSQSTRSTA
jgi:transposase